MGIDALAVEKGLPCTDLCSCGPCENNYLMTIMTLIRLVE